MTKEKLIERLKSKAWASHPRGMKDSLYLEDAIDLIEELFEQNCIKHGVSGKRPTPELFCKVHSDFYGEEVDKIEQIVVETYNGSELYELCLKFHQAACADTVGGSNKQSGEGNGQ